MLRPVRILSVLCLLIGTFALPVAASMIVAGPAGATTCNPGDVVDVSASFSPNPVTLNAVNTLVNTVVLTNCTSSSQSVDFGGNVAAPTLCGGGSIGFGPIPETLTSMQVLSVPQTVEQAPNCSGTYNQTVNVTQSGTTLSSATASFLAH
jgi:hypothetical protein